MISVQRIVLIQTFTQGLLLEENIMNLMQPGLYFTLEEISKLSRNICCIRSCLWLQKLVPTLDYFQVTSNGIFIHYQYSIVNELYFLFTGFSLVHFADYSSKLINYIFERKCQLTYQESTKKVTIPNFLFMLSYIFLKAIHSILLIAPFKYKPYQVCKQVYQSN